jgi:hypothetical protein
MSKHTHTIEHIFPDAVVDEPSESQSLIEDLAAKNGVLLKALKGTLTDTHLVDKRILDLLADLAEWDHDGDAEEAAALLARNEYIVDQVADLIEEHVAIADTPIAEIELAFSQTDDANLKKVLNVIYTKRSDTTDPNFSDLFQQALGINIDLSRPDNDFEPYGIKDLNPTAIRGRDSNLNPTELSAENVKTVGLLVPINTIGFEEINEELNNPTAASAVVIGCANTKGVDRSDERIALALPNQDPGLCESQSESNSDGAAAAKPQRKRKPRRYDEPDYRHVLKTDRIPRHWREIHIQLWKQPPPSATKKSAGKAIYGGKVTIESRRPLVTEDGTTTPKVILDSFFDFAKRESFRRYLNRYKNKWSKKPQRLIDDPWYKELNQFLLWLNQIRESQGLKYEALVSTAHIRVPRTKAKKQGGSGSYFQYDTKDDDKVAGILLLNDRKIPVRFILLHGGTGYEFDDIWEADGKEGSSDWRATWKSVR